MLSPATSMGPLCRGFSPRLWLRGEAVRSIERLVSLHRKTVRRYVQAGEAAGLVRAATGS